MTAVMVHHTSFRYFLDTVCRKYFLATVCRKNFLDAVWKSSRSLIGSRVFTRDNE